MKKIVVNQFGGPEQLTVTDLPTPEPGPGEVLVKLTSIGMNHAELMARKGEYRLTSGTPPFTPGLEGGGIIEAVGDAVSEFKPGDRVVLGVAAPRPAKPEDSQEGTYRTHFVTTPANLFHAPDNLPDEKLGTLWLSFLTTWGCLIWKQQIKPGDYVGIPAASSSVGLAASQVARAAGAIPIGLTTSPWKKELLATMPEAQFDHIIITTEEKSWQSELKRITDGHGVDVFFDPVASGEYISNELRALAFGGAIWIYGLLGKPSVLDISPLLRKRATIRGFIMGEVVDAGENVVQEGSKHILENIAQGKYMQHVAKTFPLENVQEAHREMEEGKHIGKLVLIP